MDLKSYFPRKKRKRGMPKQLGFSNEIRVAEIPLFFCFLFPSGKAWGIPVEKRLVFMG